jgi:putative transposase
LIATEELKVAAMTRRPKMKIDEDTGEALPNGTAAKSGLNRGILDAAPSMLLGMCKTKAEEAGSWLALANTRKLKPTQRCHRCGAIVKKALSDRVHECGCGCRSDRDANAALTLLRWLKEEDVWLGTSQVEPSPETSPIAASAA